MKSKTTFPLMLAGLLALSPSLYGQSSTNAATPPSAGGGAGGNRPGGPRGPGGSVDGRLNMMSETLKLTEDQKTKVRALLEEQRTARQAMRDLPQEERRAKSQEMQTELGKKLKPILTEEQYKQWETMAPGMRQGGGGRGQRGEGAGNPPSQTPPPAAPNSGNAPK